MSVFPYIIAWMVVGTAISAIAYDIVVVCFDPSLPTVSAVLRSWATEWFHLWTVGSVAVGVVLKGNQTVKVELEPSLGKSEEPPSVHITSNPPKFD